MRVVLVQVIPGKEDGYHIKCPCGKERILAKDFVERYKFPCCNKRFYERKGRREAAITYLGRTMGFTRWARELGVSRTALIKRYRNTGSIAPPNKKVLTFGAVTKTFLEWSREVGIKQVTLRFRIYSGWSAEKALTTPTRNML